MYIKYKCDQPTIIRLSIQQYRLQDIYWFILRTNFKKYKKYVIQNHKCCYLKGSLHAIVEIYNIIYDECTYY